MTNLSHLQIQTRIDVAIDLLEQLPVLALANDSRLQTFIKELPRSVAWLNARRQAGLPDTYERTI